MRRACLVLCSTATVLMSAVSIADTDTAASPLVYPQARRGDQIDDYHGVKVADPYRWMENIDDPETVAWVAAERKLTADYLAAIPDRAAINAKLTSLWNYPRWSPPLRYGKTWAWTQNDGLQNQAVLYVAGSLGAKPRVLLDPNTLSKDGTIALAGVAFSPNGRDLAYGLSEAGSDWETWRVRRVADGHDTSDELHWVKFASASWEKSGAGFFYSGYTPTKDGENLKATNEYQKVFYHRLGKPQSEDIEIYGRRDAPDWYVGAGVTDDGRYLVVQANKGTDDRNTVLVGEVANPAKSLKPLIAEPIANFSFIGNSGRELFFRTDDSAPLGRIVAIDLLHPERGNWKVVVPESTDKLENAHFVGGQLIAEYMHNACSAVRRFDTMGRLLGEVALPGLGTASGFGGRVDQHETLFSYSDFVTPGAIYRLELPAGKVSLWKAPPVAGFDASAYTTRQVFYTSRDGTRVPMFITARKDVQLDGDNPTLLYAYGGFNIPLQPAYSPAVAGWLSMGGVYALANIRGGGEFGRAWHEGGMKTHKQNVFDDFIAGAEYLVKEKWTRPQRLAIRGGSNGGLLMGAVTEQRPDLFGAVIAQVGVMDMLRFRDFTVGKGWESDYGSVDDPDEFKAIYAYSPYHNVKSGVNYPPMLITTGDHDDRVFPAHSFKFAAAMQHADPAGNPILIRIDSRAGHGAGKPTTKQIDEITDIDAFAFKALGVAPKL